MGLVAIAVLNGVGYGLLLFMLSSGLTLIFSMMGVLNFAHASFYMLGAYVAYALSLRFGFWPALIIAPLAVGLLGALFERFSLRKVYRAGHVAELLLTFGMAYILLEVVQLVWGRSAQVFAPPGWLGGPALTLVQEAGNPLRWFPGQAPAGLCAAPGVWCASFPATRAFMMAVSLFMLLVLWLLLQRTRVGLVIQAALSHPQMVQSLGHNVPRVFTVVFGVGTGLAALAGVLGGSTFVLEPGMAATLGSILFVVVVVGGLGSLSGAFLASLLIGLMQTLAIAFDQSLLSLVQASGWALDTAYRDHPLLRLSLSQLAPILPYLLLVLVLVFRPRGLLGQRDV